MQNTRFTTTQQQTVRARFLTAAGVAVAVDGVPVWTSSDESIVRVTADASGTSAVLVSGSPGTATITVTADAEIGSGTTTISQSFEVEILPDQAVQIVFEFDEPEAKGE